MVDVSPPAPVVSRACCARCRRLLEDRYHLGEVGLLCPRCACEPVISGPGSIVPAAGLGLIFLVAVIFAWGLVLTGVQSITVFPLFGLLVGPAIGAGVRLGAGSGHERSFQWLAVVLTYVGFNLGVAIHALAAGGGFTPIMLILRPVAVIVFVFTDRMNPVVGVGYLLLLVVALRGAWWAAGPPSPSPAYSLVRGGVNPPGHVLCAECGAGSPRLLTCPGCGATAAGSP